MKLASSLWPTSLLILLRPYLFAGDITVTKQNYANQRAYPVKAFNQLLLCLSRRVEVPKTPDLGNFPITGNVDGIVRCPPHFTSFYFCAISHVLALLVDLQLDALSYGVDALSILHSRGSSRGRIYARCFLWDFEVFRTRR